MAALCAVDVSVQGASLRKDRRMKTTAWRDLNHKVSAERREELKREAVAELDRMGFAALRKARNQTQVELAEKLGIDQAGVSAIENRSDLLVGTLAKYVRALGGDVEIRAVFPDRVGRGSLAAG